jgi:hypothetical protein
MRRPLLVRTSLLLIGLALIVVSIRNLQVARVGAEGAKVREQNEKLREQEEDKSLLEAFLAIREGMSSYEASKVVQLPEAKLTQTELEQLHKIVEHRCQTGDEWAQKVQMVRDSRPGRLNWRKWHHPRDPSRWIAVATVQDGVTSDPLIISKFRVGF